MSATATLQRLAADGVIGRAVSAGRPVAGARPHPRRAGQLAKSHALRGADAVHLASALAVDKADLIVAVWDRRLHAGTLAAGIQVAPASLTTTTANASTTVP